MRQLGQELELPKLTFQVIRRTIATLAQKKGTPKDIQGVLRQSRLSSTTDVYMQEIPDTAEAVKLSDPERAWRVSGIITSSRSLYGVPVITGAVGVHDRFGESGAPWELIKEFGLSAEHIAQMAAELASVRHLFDTEGATNKRIPVI
jgi:hypothetical protein